LLLTYTGIVLLLPARGVKAHSGFNFSFLLITSLIHTAYTNMDGILNINKPAGLTSFSAVAAVKRLTGERRAGHAGTLDPEATGVLPVCLGKGTRVVEFMMEAHKVYRADIELGISTDTYDGEGKITARGDVSTITRDLLEDSLQKFRGDILQVPPMYSALKHQGQPLYALAREGIDIERKSRPVAIYRLELTGWQTPFLTLEIECSKGTYIRSLANDLGEKLGCGGYMKTLVRTGYGIFDIGKAISLTQLEETVKQGALEQYLYPIDSVLVDLPSITVDEANKETIKTGSPPDAEAIIMPPPDKKYCRAYSEDGRFLAILHYDPDENKWRPKKVFI
jgi:tRNA pseudouridine55 synthase